MPDEEDKSLVRTRVRQIVERVPQADLRQASDRLAERVLAWTPIEHARCVMVFLSMPGEADTAELVHRLMARGVKVAVPRVDWDGRVLTPAELRDAEADIVEGRHGVPEPAPHAPAVAMASVDVVLVPGVAFDLRGFRLGRGGGFYDRLLARPDRRGLALGLALEAQLISRVPTEPHDARLDAVATERRLLEINGPRIAAVLDDVGR
ncbi:MAG: 5-formyltetrahydrofolate cyclo-ligase [Planctomycetota bacterium]